MNGKRSAFVASIALVIGCAAPAEPPTPSPGTTASVTAVTPSRGASPSAPAPTDSTAPVSSPGPSPAASPSLPAATFRPDTYPSWLVGRLYAIRDPATHDVSLTRVGMPGRVPLAEGSLVLGSFGDRVITSQPGNSGTTIQILSFDVGGEIASVSVTGSASGSPFADGILMDNLEVIGTDGSIRHLRDPGPRLDVEIPVRVIAISESGRRVATSLCEAGIEDAYNCRPTSIIDIASGELVDTVDAGPLPVSRFTGRWLLTRSFVSAAVVDPAGRALWDGADLSKSNSNEVAIWRLDILGGQIVAIADGIEDSRVTLLRIDPLTGAHRVLFRYEYGADWRLWGGWSSDRFAVLGHDDDALHGVVGPLCEDCPNVIDAATVDLETGAFDPDAIHINVGP